MSPEEAADRVRKLSVNMRKPALNGLSNGVTRWRKRYIDKLRTRGISRSILKKSGNALERWVQRTKGIDRGDEFITGLTVKGLGALMEAGGRTKPHTITAVSGKRLVFQGRKGTVVIQSVHHKGGRVRAVRNLQQTLNSELPNIVAEMDLRLQETANRTVG